MANYYNNSEKVSHKTKREVILFKSKSYSLAVKDLFWETGGKQIMSNTDYNLRNPKYIQRNIVLFITNVRMISK